jgi:hypothetical protein
MDLELDTRREIAEVLSFSPVGRSAADRSGPGSQRDPIRLRNIDKPLAQHELVQEAVRITLKALEPLGFFVAPTDCHAEKSDSL